MRTAYQKEMMDSNHKWDLEAIEFDTMALDAMTDLDTSIVSYGPIYRAFSKSGKFSLNGSDGDARREYLRTLNV